MYTHMYTLGRNSSQGNLSPPDFLLGCRECKMCLFLSTLPTIGLGQLINREDPNGTEAESKVLACEDDFYRGLADRCSRQQICLDTFLFSSQFTDVATILKDTGIYAGSYVPAHAVRAVLLRAFTAGARHGTPP